MSDIDKFLGGETASNPKKQAPSKQEAQQPSQIDSFLSDAPPQKASAVRKLGDLALGFGQGAVGATKALSDAFGANNAVSQGLEGVNQGLDSFISEETKSRRLEADRIQQEAKGKGIAAETAGFVKAFATDPAQMMAQGAGSIVPNLAVQFIPGVGQSATAARLAQVGMGLGMGAGTAKGAIHEEVQKRELAAGKTAEQAQAAADAAQAYGGGNTDQIALGAGLGLADAVTGATPAAVRLLRQKLGKEVLEETGKKAGEGIFKAGAKGALAEMPVEFAQGGQEQLAANIAAQRAGYEADTWEGVVGKGGLEALASAGPGAAFGIAGRNRGAGPQPQPDPNAPRADGQPPVAPQGGVAFDSNVPPPAAVLDSGRIRMVDLGTEQQPINASEQQGGPKNSDEDGYLGSSITPISIGGQETFIAQHPENVMRQMQGLEQNPRLNKIAASRQDAERLIGDMWLGYGNKDNDKLVQDFLSNVNGSTYTEPLSDVPASKRMGLDAAAGPLSAVAVTAVDSGASPAAAALASGVGGGFGLGRARGEPVDVTPIDQAAGQIGATKRLGETPIIDVEARWKDEGPRQGDMMAPNNAPFQSQALALQASQQTPQGGEVVAVPNGFVVRPQLLGIEQPTQPPRLGYVAERKGAATQLAERQPPAQAPQRPPEKYQSEPVRSPESRQNTVQPSAEPPRLGMTPAQQRTTHPIRDYVENPEYGDTLVLKNGEQSNAAKNTASKLPKGQFARLAINRKSAPYENASKTTTHGAWVSDGNGGARWVEEPAFESRKTPPSEKRIGELFDEAVKQESEKEQKKIQQVNARKEQFKNMGVAIGSELKGAQAYVAGKKGITTYSRAKVDSFDENGMAIIRATLRGSKHEYKLVAGPESSIFDGLRKTAPESRQQPPVRDGSTPIAMGMEGGGQTQPQIFTGKSALFDGYGASVGSVAEGTRRQLMVDVNGGYFWGDWRQESKRDVGAVAGGADKDATPASFASSQEARKAAEATPLQASFQKNDVVNQAAGAFTQGGERAPDGDALEKKVDEVIEAQKLIGNPASRDHVKKTIIEKGFDAADKAIAGYKKNALINARAKRSESQVISDAVDDANDQGLYGDERKDFVHSALAREWSMNAKEVAKLKSVAAALKKKLTPEQEAKVAARKEEQTNAFVERVKRQALKANARMMEQIARGDANVDLVSSSQQEAPTRPANWRKNMISAAKVAKDMGITAKGKKLKDLVAEIDAADVAAKPSAAEPPTKEAASEKAKNAPQIDTSEKPVENQGKNRQVATHKDPGEKAEVVTPAVVADSLKTAAKNEDVKPSDMKKWLLGEIDKAMLTAPDRDEYNDTVKAFGEKDAVKMWASEGYGGKGRSTHTGFLTFDVPGDGKFKVRNGMRGLLEFRQHVERSKGFSNTGANPVNQQKNSGVQNGSGSNMTAITNMIEEGDFEAARDFAEAVGIKLEDVKLPRGERRGQWDDFLKNGTVPPPPFVQSRAWVFGKQLHSTGWKRVAELKRMIDGAEYVATVITNLEFSVSAEYVITKDGKEFVKKTYSSSFMDALKDAQNAIPKASGNTDVLTATGEKIADKLAAPNKMTPRQFDDWIRQRATIQTEQFRGDRNHGGGDEGVGYIHLSGKVEAGGTNWAGVARGARDKRDTRLIFRTDDNKIVWYDDSSQKVYEVQNDDARLEITRPEPAPKKARDPQEITVTVDGSDYSITFDEPLATISNQAFQDNLDEYGTPGAAKAEFRKLLAQARSGGVDSVKNVVQSKQEGKNPEPQNERTSQSNLEQPAGAKPVQGDAVGAAKNSGATASPPAAQAGRSAQIPAAGQAPSEVKGNRGKTIVERRQDAVLDSPSKVGSGTKREVIEAAVRNGYAIVEKTARDTASKKRDREAVDRAFRAGYALGPYANDTIPIVKEGNAAQARLKEDKYEKPEYRIYSDSREDGPFREISKIEYEYAQKLKKELSVDAAPAQPTTQPSDDAILDDELKDALGKLGDVLGDVFGAKLNITGQQYTAGDLLPALSKVVELLVKKGFKSFSQSTGKAAQLMRADPRTAAHVDSISPRQWKAAYNAIAEEFEGTDSEDTINAMKADEVLAIVAPLRPAVQNPQKTENDNAALEKPSQKALGNVPTKNDSRPEGSRKAGASPASGGNQSGNSGAGVDGERVSTTRSGGGGASGVSDSATGAARAGRPRGDGTAGNGAGVPPTDGRLNTPETASAPNIPSANFAITPDLKLGTGGEVVKFNDNIAAIKTLKTLETERRRATPDEQRVLARFVGWGGLANAFPNPETGEFKSEWVKRGNELRDLLTPSEYRAASRSTRNAHYTSETVVGAMWDAARRLGYRNGLALESSMGSGNFLGLMPRDMAARFIGVEYDSITARLAGALYPQATVLHSGFQDVALPDGAFDLDIGNPPFGSESLRFQYKPELKGLSIHNQFFLAGIDALRPGGLKISVVSSFLMDSQDSSTRIALAGKAKLVAAIRLPSTAFKENARTEVVTDIVILQRRSAEDEANATEAVRLLTKPLSAKEQRDMSPLERQRRAELADEYRKELRWMTTSPVKDPLGGEPILVNSYFADNPNQIIGTMDRSGTMRTSGMMNVRLDDPTTLGKRLGELVDKLPKDILSTATDVAERTEQAYKLLGESLRISVARQEPGQVLFDEDGNLVRVVEREYGDGTLLQRQVLTPQSPFSSQLFLDSMGRWYKVDVRMDADGKPMKLVKDGKATKLNEYVRTNYEKESDIPESMRLGQLNYERMKDLAGMRDLLKRQLVLETEDAPKVMMEGNRKKLASAYQAYVDKHGPINRRANAALLSDMPDGGLVLALESNYEPARTAEQAKRSGLPQQSETVKPAPIMRERVVPKYEPPTKASTPADALAIVLAERGVVDMERIAKLLGQDTEKAVAALTSGESPLVFKDPETNTFETANAYLSGQVRRKLMAAKSAGLEQNIKALESVQPERWGAEKVSVQIGATWVPSEVYADFAKHLMGGTASVHHSALTNTFSVKVHNEDRGKSDQWATERMSGVKILEKLLNSQTPNVMTKDMDGNLRLDKDATALAILKGREIVAEFDDWIFKDGDRRELLVDQFNEKFNTRVMRQYDGQHLTLPGKVPDTIIKMRRHQLNAIWRGISSRFMLVDHTVGAGKTFTAIARAMERRRMGLAKKPTVVVPNHLVEQWAADVYRLYPAAKVLAATKKDFEKSNRRRLLSRVATGDYDIVILPHSSFGFVGIAPETELRYLEEELKQALAAVGEAEKQAEDDGDVGFRKPLGVKEAERLVAKIESRMANLRNSARDRLLTFEQLGIDDLTIDEAHEFKNLFYSSRLTKVRGMGDKIGSRKAADLYNKVRVLRDSGGAITFMTGTPVSNSVVELYTMMRYLAPNELREMGMEHFDAWRAQFVDASPAFEPNESGRLQEVTRLGRTWSNMRNMMDLYYTFTDAVTNDDIKKWYREDNSGKEFPIPKVKGGDRQLRKVIPTEAQESYLKEIIAGFDGLPDIKDIQERNATRLRLMDRARKLSLDVRAALPGSTSKEKGGKLEQIASEVKRIYAKTTKDLGTQIVFLDRSVPKAKGDDKKIKEFDALIAKRDKALSDGDDIGFQKINETLEAYDSQEIEELRLAQSGGWNAYKQLKENMVALGIPADEIRFVQDANTDEQKQALFDAVNGGKVRVLIGSTPRMGAGTNVQQRLVGLHHADVTWKPSDIEQREGRIIRQGNLFATPPTADKPNPLYRADFEVEILAYATERTVDAKMWSLNATKLKAINGLRKYTGDFTMELEDEESVSMAEMAALASGNPLLLERVTLESDIQKLELQERSHRRKVHGAEDEVKRAKNIIETYPERIKNARELAEYMIPRANELSNRASSRVVSIDGKQFKSYFDAMREVANSITAQQAGNEHARYVVDVNGNRLTSKNAIDEAVGDGLGDSEPFEVEIQGKTFTRRTSAGRELAEVLSPKAALMADRGTIGSMLGLDLKYEFSKREGGRIDMELWLERNGKTVASDGRWGHDPYQKFTTSQMRDLIGNIARSAMNSAHHGTGDWFEEKLNEAHSNIQRLMEQTKEAFPKAQELKDKRQRLKDVVATLTSDSPKPTQDDTLKMSRGGGAALPPTITVDGVERPTTNSNGQPIASTEEGVRNFWRWFGDSKVVDDDGRPLVVYHGTRNKRFNAFDWGKAREGTYGTGFYFTSDRSRAEGYAGPGGRVIEAYLKVDNLFDTRLQKTIGDGSGKNFGVSSIDEFMVERPTQIKSATGKNGTFDPQNPSILKSGQGQTAAPQPATPRTPKAKIKAALDKAYGRLFGRLEAKGLVTLTQTEQEAIEAAARARADELGRDYDAELATMLASVNASSIGGESTAIDVKYSSSGLIQGFFDPATNRAYIVSDALFEDTAGGVLMHEVGIHMAASGGKLTPLVNRAAFMVKNANGAFFDDVRKKMARAGETSAEEAAAYLVEAYENSRGSAPSAVKQWFKDFVAAVRAWLFKAGGGLILTANQLTAADIAAVARANARGFARGGAGGMTMGQSVRRSFAGEGALTANKDALAEAKKRTGKTMLEQLKAKDGKERVFSETGWFKGVDGKWRFEIDDSKAVVNFEKIRETMENRASVTEKASELSKKLNEITAQRKAFLKSQNQTPSKISAAVKSMPEFQSIDAAHKAAERSLSEVQFKFFESGSMILGDILAHKDLYDAYPSLKGVRVVLSNNQDVSGSMASLSGNHVLEITASTIGKGNEEIKSVILHELQHAIQADEGFARGSSILTYKKNAEEYMRSAGETEARNVEARMGMSKEQRKATYPTKTQDRSNSQLTVDFGQNGMPSASIPIYEWAERETAPIGAWVKENYKLGDSQPVLQVRDIPIESLYLPELDERGKLSPNKRRYIDEYTGRVKAGEKAPAISVVEMRNGKLRVTDGHRRVLAAQAAGKQTIRALVSPLVDTPDGRVEATAENIQSTPSIPIQSTDERGFPVINGDGVTLQFGEPVERIEFIPVHDGQRMIRFQIGSESNPFAGLVDVLFENDKPIALYDIEVYQSERGKKTASKAVKALLDASQNGKLEVSNIVTEAQEFWATLGIPTQPNLPKGYAYDGTITTKSFNSSSAGKNARAAGGVAEDWFEAGERNYGGRAAIEGASGIETQELSWEELEAQGIRFSRTGGNGQPPTGAVPNYFDVKGTASQAKEGMADRLADWRGLSMQALGRRQIVDLWGKLLPQLGRYDDLVQKMDAEKNATAAVADELATAWAALDGKGFLGFGKAKNAGMEAKLAELMHDATLRGVDADPSVPLPNDATIAKKMAKGAFAKRFDALTPDAQAVYRKVRDIYADQNKAIRKALTERIERAAELSPDSKRTMIAKMDAEMLWEKQGVYFPLARFGKYLVVVKNARGKTVSVSRAETLPESKKLRAELQSRYPSDQGFRVSKVYLDHEFNAARDAVGKGFMGDLVQTLRNEGMDEGVIDSVGQLYLKSLPDLSWAKHGIHRKGTPGFSQDARRAFAQNMIHGASHLAKLRYADRLQMELADMQAHIKANQNNNKFDNVKAVQVYDEMVKRHDLLMSPKTHPLSTALTSAGFLFYLGLSPASAAVNLSQTALLAYPIMGAKWGYDKAGAALLKASAEVAKAKNDYRSALQGDELKALNQAIDDGTIDVTMAHDLAGIASGEDQRVTWAMRPVMRAASFMFHHAEKFNRQATFIAAYRLARENPKTTHEQAFAEARKATYDGHFDYSAANRPRVMQGNWAKVLLLFKQYGQNMVYTLARQTYLSIKGDTPEQKKEARKAIAGILALHASAAGVLGLPVVGTLLALASAMGGDDDEPWDAKVAIQNALAESLGQKPAEVLAHGLSRLTPWDMSGRVALNSLILPDVQEGLEGQRLAESAMTAALGPVAGIGTGIAKGVQKMSQGDYARGFEDMLPVALRNPLKAMRYASEGNVDKSGVVINDEVSAAGVAGQALGFSPSETRLAAEGKQAIYQADKRLSERRAQLMRLYSMAKMADDDEGVTEARESIARFNAKNPDRKITVIQLAQSVKSRQKRIAEAQQGVYLPEKRRGALEAGRFAVTE